MDVHQLRVEQKAHAASHLGALFKACARRYLDAARLLEVNGSVVDALSQSLYEAIDLAPLLSVYQCSCERYNSELYSPQQDLWGEAQDEPYQRWSRFFHHGLVPTLVADSQSVRNVLRVMGKLPCTNPGQASAALVAEVTNMALPGQVPLPLLGGLPEYLG